MSEPPPSIGLLFDRESLDLPALVATASGALQRASHLGASTLEPAFWITSANRVVELVKSLTDIPLADVLVGGWKVHGQFAKYADPAQFPPDKVSCVALATHHIKSSYDPSVELTVDGVSAGKIEFTIELDVCLEAGTLVIQAGKIKRLEAGKCRVTGTLKCEGQTVTQRTSRDLAWSGGIAFGDGIPISAAL
jgi:hypothetical protein